MLVRLGRFAASYPWRFITAWLLTVAVLVGLVFTVGPAFSDNITAPASESSEGLDILTANFSSAGGDQGTIVFRAEQGVADPAVQASMSELFEPTKQIDSVVNVISPYSPM
jgi:RND superfamily putative drug exporter